MAALDELASSRERKQFLDAQSADLNEAMQTLTDAIAKIDAETRELLQGTFNEVNGRFGRLFPELSGGGHAQNWFLAGEETLDSRPFRSAGVPQASKNSRIDLLSGGEEASAAIASRRALSHSSHRNPAPLSFIG
jgi:chromosome segregation protein